MSLISGYARQKEPRWPYFVGGLAILLLIVFLFFIYFSLRSCVAELLAKKKSVATVATSTTVKAKAKEKDQEASKVIKVGEIRLKPEAGSRIYCYTTILSDQLPTKVKHVWLRPDGSEYVAIDLKISSNPAKTWSYVNLAESPKGEWRVEVRLSDGKKLAEKSFILD